MRQQSPIQLTEIALVTGLATLLDKLPLFTLPQGGSITLAMLPILLLAFRRGKKAGLTAGLLTGCLQLVLGAYILNPFQVILDYLLAYTVLGIAGCNQTRTSLQISLATLLATSLRLICHVLAGIIFYGQFAPEGIPVWLYALIYNASFLLPASVITLALLLILYKNQPKLFQAP